LTRIAEDKKGPLFRPTCGKTRQLTEKPLRMALVIVVLVQGESDNRGSYISNTVDRVF
jgi:hypothetical protein